MKNTNKRFLIGIFLLISLTNICAQQVQGFVHTQSKSSDYVWPCDSAVRHNLERWQDLKFGVILHWGLYSVPGIVESWSICSEDEDWIPRNPKMTYDDYKKWYWSLKDSLKPVHFNPSQWAEVMQEAGMKYMVFTTKHHDGFCMYDSKYTDFSIAHGAFRDDPRKNVAWHVFDAFRKKKFMIGCYFSKPDWHCNWYWNRYFATPDRHQNYKKEKHQEWWRKYQQFTANQLGELTSDYGRLDILWLDGGWVSGDDIQLDSILVEARKRQPGLIAVDRTARGKNENYQTPERSIPPVQLDYPWESCLTLGSDWGWTPHARYKSARTVIALLAEVVSKGGCLLLGVGPTPDGLIEKQVQDRLHEVGAWLKTNGRAIYSTRTTSDYVDGNTWFTADKDGKTLYAIYTLKDSEELPQIINWKGNLPQGKMVLLQNGKTVRYEVKGENVYVYLPEKTRPESLVFSFKLRK